MNKLIFTINSMFLIVGTLMLAVLISREINLKRWFDSGIERSNKEYYEKRIRREMKRYGKNLKIKMNLIEKIEFCFVEKSNIRKYIPFANAYTLLVLCFFIFTITFEFVYKALLSVFSAAIISLLFSLIPIFVLDILSKYNSEKIRRKLAEFISVLNRWCAVKEDIFYAFGKSVDSGIDEPLGSFIRDMVIQVNRGIDPLAALDILSMKVDDVQFRDFIINIKQNVRHRGDIRILLANLENQFYRIEEEYNRRRISTYKDRILVYCTMFAVLIIGYYFLKVNPKVEEFYLSTLEGKSILTLFSILFASGFFMSFRITKFKG